MTTKEPIPFEILSGGYAASTVADDKRKRKIAASFRPNPHYERVLELKQRDPAAYAKLDTATTMGAAMYEQAKQIAEEVNDGDSDEAA